MALQGHVKSVLSVAFSPTGYQMATGSEDNTARIWDLRKQACLYMLPAHESTVAMVGSNLFALAPAGTKRLDLPFKHLPDD